jgi:hypothetical protein
VKLPDLDAALVLAMKTIENASQACSGKAVRLLPSPADEAPSPLPVPSKLQGMSTNEYAGYYHTDHTVPAVYFRPDIERPADVAQFVLDFTYLHLPSADNPAHITMGRGLRVRHDEDGLPREATGPVRDGRVHADLLPVAECPRLVRALAGPPPG